MPRIQHRKNKLVERVRRIRGQLEAVERALEDGAGVKDLLQTLAAARGAMNGLVATLMEEHIRAELVGATALSAKREKALDDLLHSISAYVK